MQLTVTCKSRRVHTLSVKEVEQRDVCFLGLSPQHVAPCVQLLLLKSFVTRTHLLNCQGPLVQWHAQD